jgi:hypothetical protein
MNVQDAFFYLKKYGGCFPAISETAGLRKKVSKFLHIDEPVVEKLATDFNFDEKTATDKFFSSNTFSKLADISSNLYEKDRTEIDNLRLSEPKSSVRNNNGRKV